MSIRNQRTRRHEDDIMYHARQQAGMVTVEELLEHCEEIIADTPEAYGENVSEPVRALCELVRSLIAVDVRPTGVRLDRARVSLRVR